MTETATRKRRGNPNGAQKYKLREEAFLKAIARGGVTQQQIAGALRVQKGTVSRWKSGIRNVPGPTALKLASLLDVRFGALFEELSP